jgi:hypothetical protein
LKTPVPAEKKRLWKRVGIACYRLGILAAAFFCVHAATARRVAERDNRLDSPEVLATVREFLPAAAALGEPDGDDRLCSVVDAEGDPLGWVAQTRPEADAIIGYNGPSNLLVVFDRSRRVLGTSLLESADTPGHVAKVVEDQGFFGQWNGRSQSSLGAPGRHQIVSGASLTSEAMARGVAARFGAVEMHQWFPDTPALEDVRPWFPEAASLAGNQVLDSKGSRIGTLLVASRTGVAVRGFQGASEVWLALDAEEKSIMGVAMPASRDNEPYVPDVRDGLRFETPFTGMPVEKAMAIQPGTTLMVSGASRTAEAVEETVGEMLRRHLRPPPQTGPRIGLREGAALAWLAAGLIIGLGPLRGRPGIRLAYAVASVVLGGLWLGLMTGQDQWIKSAMRGSVSGMVLPLLALTAAAILVPAAFGRNVYCAQLCPHGAAQQLLGKLRLRRRALPTRWSRALAAVPWMTLLALWLMAFLGMSVPFAHAEPFEVWSAGFFALLPVAIFLIGFAAALFLPQAYCHYGCPTGAALRFLAAAPGRWTRRDAAAGLLVGMAATYLMLS